MTDSQRHRLIHALGIEHAKGGKPYRNYYNTNLNGSAFDDCLALVNMGFMVQGRTIPGPSVYFHLTAQGVQAVMGLATPMADIEAFIQTGDWPKKRRRARA